MAFIFDTDERKVILEARTTSIFPAYNTLFMKRIKRNLTPLNFFSLGAVLVSLFTFIEKNWLHCLIPLFYLALPSIIGQLLSK